MLWNLNNLRWELFNTFSFIFEDPYEGLFDCGTVFLDQVIKYDLLLLLRRSELNIHIFSTIDSTTEKVELREILVMDPFSLPHIP